MRRIVCDTGPPLHLEEADALNLLEASGEVRIPPAVHSELLDHVHAWQNDWPAWLKQETLDAEHTDRAAAWHRAGLLDLGEAQALALTLQTRSDWLLTDDAAARLMAASLGIEVHGSLGVVLWGAVAGHLSYEEAEATLTALSRTSLWISARVLEEARSALRQIFS